jgi:hypothetical protein
VAPVVDAGVGNGCCLVPRVGRLERVFEERSIPPGFTTTLSATREPAVGLASFKKAERCAVTGGERKSEAEAELDVDVELKLEWAAQRACGPKKGAADSAGKEAGAGELSCESEVTGGAGGSWGPVGSERVALLSSQPRCSLRLLRVMKTR